MWQQISACFWTQLSGNTKNSYQCHSAPTNFQQHWMKTCAAEKNVMEKQRIIHKSSSLFGRTVNKTHQFLFRCISKWPLNESLPSFFNFKNCTCCQHGCCGVCKSTMKEIFKIITSTGHCKAIAALHHTTWDQRRMQPTNLKMFWPNCLTLIVTLRQNNKGF